MSAPELTEVISVFHQGSDCLTQFFAEQGRSDNDMLMAFDEIDQFLLTAEELSLQATQKQFFAARANELLLLIDRLMVFSMQIQHQKSFAFFSSPLPFSFFAVAKRTLRPEELIYFVFSKLKTNFKVPWSINSLICFSTAGELAVSKLPSNSITLYSFFSLFVNSTGFPSV